MKVRSRCNENKVAEELSKWYAKFGFTHVERIPILGIEGPDITTNELEIIIDAKSRKKVSISYLLSGVGMITDDRLVGIRLRDLDVLLGEHKPTRIIPPSVTIGAWFDHLQSGSKTKCLTAFQPLYCTNPVRTWTIPRS